jgi:hypothetical protein
MVLRVSFLSELVLLASIVTVQHAAANATTTADNPMIILNN